MNRNSAAKKISRNYLNLLAVRKIPADVIFFFAALDPDQQLEALEIAKRLQKIDQEKRTRRARTQQDPAKRRSRS